ncbi:MAG: hypothetical protein ACR2JO_05525 [Mycobacteriales bacterium]
MSLAENAKKLAAKAQAAAGGNKGKLEKGIRKAAQTLDAGPGANTTTRSASWTSEPNTISSSFPTARPTPPAKPEADPPRR